MMDKRIGDWQNGIVVQTKVTSHLNKLKIFIEDLDNKVEIKSDQFNIGKAESFTILYWIGCRIIIRDESLKKRMFTSVNPPPSPQTGVSQMPRITSLTTEKQFEVQTLASFRKYALSIDPKCSWKRVKKSGMGTRGPPTGQCPNKKHSFFPSMLNFLDLFHHFLTYD